MRALERNMTSPNYTNRELLSLNTFIKLVRCSNTVGGDVHRYLPKNLTVSQFGILEALYHLGPLSQKELCTKILKSPGNITTVINNMEKSGLVVRRENPDDKRFYSIVLTSYGRDIIEEIFPGHTKIIKHRFEHMTEKELATLSELLKKLSLG